MDEDGEITLTLSLRQWRAVATQVEGGIHREVWPILCAIYAQVNAQITAANERIVAEAIAEIQASASTSAQPESVAEDFPNSQSDTQRAALH